MKKWFYVKALMAALISATLFSCSSGSSSSGAKNSRRSGSAPGLDQLNKAFTGETTALWDLQNPTPTDWSSFLSLELDARGPDLLDVIIEDANTFCPNYKNLNLNERKQFWIFLISAMSYFESTFNETATNPSDASPSDSKVPRGLLQMSKHSVNDYGCQIANPTDLHDAHTSLSCSVRVLNKLVGQDGRIGGKVAGKWRGGARYWSVLREGDKRSYRSIVNWTSRLDICR